MEITNITSWVETNSEVIFNTMGDEESGISSLPYHEYVSFIGWAPNGGTWFLHQSFRDRTLISVSHVETDLMQRASVWGFIWANAALACVVVIALVLRRIHVAASMLAPNRWTRR